MSVRGSQRAAGSLSIVFAAAAGAVVGVQSLPAAESRALDAFERGLQSVSVMPPSRPPVPSQADVDLAMALYSIRKPHGLGDPLFDGQLEDRGLTSGSTLSGPQTVTIGPAAFSSWALLGSTLAHEIEVHGRQSFFRIVMEDELFGALSGWTRGGMALAGRSDESRVDQECKVCGTVRAEREAYQYEINNAARFGLTDEEVRLIRQVMDFYYSDKH